jgi:hypothetical protein
MSKLTTTTLLSKRKKLIEKKAGSALPFKLEEHLFAEQLAFVRDPNRFVTACCSVRSGKTTSCAADLIDTCLRMPGTTSLYITLARTSGKKILLPEIRNLLMRYGINAKVNLNELSITFANHSVIYISGANNEAEIEKVRGLSNVALAYLDESQAFRSHIKELVEDILVKRLYDTNGRMRVIGTPGPLLRGWFYETCHSKNWGHHSWSMFQNPWLLKKSGKTPEQLTQQDCEMRGVPITHPSIQRENFGRWCYDPEAILLTYKPEVNDYETLPAGIYTYLLGIDLGWKDSDSLSLLAFPDNSKVTYLVEEQIISNQLTDDLAARIKVLMERYSIAKMVVDAGGLGKKIVEDLKSRYGLPLEPADKKDKMANYRLLNNALRTGLFKAKRDSRFAVDCDLLEVDRDKSQPEKIVVKGHSDAIDSTLYAFKFSPAYVYQAPAPTPEPGSPEHHKQFEESMLINHFEKVRKEQNPKDEKERDWPLDDKGVPPWNKW